MGLFSSSQETKTRRDPYDQQGFNDFLASMRGLRETPMEMFPDQMYANLDPLQQEALRGQEAAARGMQGGILTPGTEAWASTLNAPDVANNPYVNAMLEQQSGLINRNLQENQLPSIRRNAVGAGQLGSARQGVAEGLASRGASEAIGQAATATQLGAYGQGLDQQRYGIGAMPGIMANQMMPSEMLGQVGAFQRAEDQRGIDEQMQRFNFAQQEPWARQERFAQTYLPATSPYGTSTAKQSTTPSGLQIAGQLGGAALTGAMGAGAMGFGPAAGMFSGAGGGVGSAMAGNMAGDAASGIMSGGMPQNFWGMGSTNRYPGMDTMVGGLY